MDEAHVDFQVLSLAAIGFDSLDSATASTLAREINDELASAVHAHPDRFGGFATLAVKDPESAANELERCVSKLGFCGAMLNGTSEGKFLDDAQFLPVFETAAQLGVPIYLHPAPPPRSVYGLYFAGLPEETADMLATAAWGWHAETGLHTLRLIVSGLFDRVPKLQLIIGHMGEVAALRPCPDQRDSLERRARFAAACGRLFSIQYSHHDERLFYAGSAAVCT